MRTGSGNNLMPHRPALLGVEEVTQAAAALNIITFIVLINKTAFFPFLTFEYLHCNRGQWFTAA